MDDLNWALGLFVDTNVKHKKRPETKMLRDYKNYMCCKPEPEHIEFIVSWEEDSHEGDGEEG